MGAHTPMQAERLTPRSAARIDPIVYVAEARARQARAMAEALRAGWHHLRSGLTGLGTVARRLWQPLARQSGRNRALRQLRALDDRLLADIGLRRPDIELAVDGVLADPRVKRRAAAIEQLLEHRRSGLPAMPANSNRSALTERAPDLAA